MRLDDFDYVLPPDRIAQVPVAVRGQSRLLVLDRESRAMTDSRFDALGSWLRAGDLLVRNDARVLPARLRGRRGTGGSLEVLLLEPAGDGDGEDGETWSCLARPGRRLRPGDVATFDGDAEGEWLDEPDDRGVRRIRLRCSGSVLAHLERHGEVPLPPYIDRSPSGDDRERYQTTYARSVGAVAAPTAGLHFTPEVDRRLGESGVEIRHLTLRVGPGTFLPLRDPIVERNRLESELATIPEATAAAVLEAKTRGRRVVAVGTTTVRALEGLLGGDTAPDGAVPVSLFIVPGHRFRVVDALVTNFHLPRSSLLMLVAAFAERETILAAYRHAIDRGYRFYSYGDAMLIR